MLEILVVLLIAHLFVYVYQLKKEINLLAVNPNFGVLTRTAGMNICKRRRSTSLSVVTFDVAQMGKYNSEKGEVWVNTCVTTGINVLRQSLRKTDIISQLNSGDEFFIIINKGDEESVINKTIQAFEVWPGGIYISSAEVDVSGILPAVNKSMENVYQIKKERKLQC